MKNLLFLLLLTSCVTEKGVQRYLKKNPQEVQKVFVYEEKHDTTIIHKDSMVIERITDSFYTWFADTHYIDRWRVKNVLMPCKDSLIYIYKPVYNAIHKKQLDEKKLELEAMIKSRDWWRKGLLLAFSYIAGFSIIMFLIRRK